MASNRSLTLRTQNYKYISPSEGGPMIPWGPKIETGYRPTPQLFNLSKSEYEQTDISKKNPKLLQRLQRMLGKVRQN